MMGAGDSLLAQSWDSKVLLTGGVWHSYAPANIVVRGQFKLVWKGKNLAQPHYHCMMISVTFYLT